MRNEWDQSQSEAKHVKKHSTKFHLHMIRDEDFTRYVSELLKKNPKMTKQQSKMSIKQEMNQQFLQKFMVKLDIYKVSHAKNQSHRPSESMEN